MEFTKLSRLVENGLAFACAALVSFMILEVTDYLMGGTWWPR